MFRPAESHLCEADAEWLIPSYQNRLLISPGKPWAPLPANLVEATGFVFSQRHYLGTFHNGHCFVAECEADAVVDNGIFEWTSLYSQLGSIHDELFQLAGRALQITRWYADHQYCGRCGTPTRDALSDRARVCTRCTLRFYPRISPCIICLVQKDRTCLLARSPRHPPGLYSTLAGFIEPGESVEQALRREIHEEVGIGVKNIRYFGSQPWPFPGQLMLGFTAEHDTGDIRPDGQEILEANWYTADNMPLVPPESTLSGQLIVQFIRQTLSQTRGNPS